MFLLQVPSQFVESMLTVHSKFTEVIKSVFNSDQQFIGALDKVWNLKVHLVGFFCSISSFKSIVCSFVPKTDISFSTI